ncbi:ABC transporter permease subunit [Sphaerisporangium aureirubrum]|uniref:ATP-binding cassette domain-containing protein n=1 Tax=Sphaerisporangium aureirubrum TaxID=1544736 RepID=A0ABW1NJ15_9ACTN
MMRRDGTGLSAAFLVLVAVGAFSDQLGLPSFYLILLGSICFWIAQATSWNILSGYSGYFSFGQAAYVGVGAYTTAVLSGRYGVGFFLTIPLAAVLCGLLALGVGAVAFRLGSLRGEIFALLTLAVPFILAAFARINRSIDGGQGSTVPIPELPDAFGSLQQFQYLLALLVAAVAVAVAYAVQHSRTGSALAAIRDAEDVAEVMGVATFRYKMLAMLMSGVLGGVAGSVYALQIGFVTVESVFGLTIPLFVIVMAVLGGRTHWLGPVIGAVLIVVLQDRLSSYGLDAWYSIILGGVLALLVALSPDGLYARLRARPLVALGSLLVAGGGLAVLGDWGELLDWLLAGMLAAGLSAIVLGSRWGTARFPVRRTGTTTRSAPAEPVPAGPVSAEPVPAEPVPAEPVPAEPVSAEPVPAASVSASAKSVAAASVAAEPVPAEVVAGEAGAGDGAGRLGAVLVECREVARHFGGVHALEDVTLDIRAGELVGLVGPNGSGKTTLVNLLSGAFRPTRGLIRLDGQDITRMAPHKIAHVGMARTYQIPRAFGSTAAPASPTANRRPC